MDQPSSLFAAGDCGLLQSFCDRLARGELGGFARSSTAYIVSASGF
ncbi:MAG: hypothetical protein GX491_15005 [Chloroflexi bacterium]|nr:hypothetical protein [Chloroflexota bacterium]